MEKISCTKYYEADICTNEQCVFKNCCYYYLIGKKEVTYSSNTTGYETIEKEIVTNGVKYIAVEEAEQMPVPVQVENIE